MEGVALTLGVIRRRIGGAGGPESGPVAVLEADPTGHRLQYLRHIIDAAGAHRCLVLVTAEAARSEEHARYLGAESHSVVLPTVGSRYGLLRSAVHAAVAAGASRLVVPDGDLYLGPLLRLVLLRPRLRLRIHLLLMRTTEIGGPEPLRTATLAKPVLVQLLRISRHARVSFLTDAFGVVARRRGYPGVHGVRDPVAVAPSPAMPGRPAWFPHRDEDTAVVGLFGVVSSRKNLPLLVDAVALLPRTTLVVGGRLEADVRDWLDESAQARALVRGGRLVVVDRLLDHAEFGAALTHADVVAVLHDNDTPSGIMAEACLRATPAIVPVGGWLAEIAAAHGTAAVTAMRPEAVADTIRHLLSDRGRYSDAARRCIPRLGTSGFTDSLLDR